ncbi:autotransporter outer membrane beta-barrel domain-containing protein [Altererythrobacter sp. CC-YST694]|uniref:autotransporter outer membrane beta-barrel domain-containing protein n=1 Tax=Altererythrobacter sp. CC-YST694 TaxID=2755038 RepID=UPI001D032C64|nr:autotransporter outer membrane beta-barrel domain-containing protein [Altererythrobacter sp. CC-YST694]MCB5424624.1 autotransporter outer membrane beta-barrel domain-containing protein [Altererythrobacter sp. CC-YST694]
MARRFVAHRLYTLPIVLGCAALPLAAHAEEAEGKPRQVSVTPYIEAAQVLTAELSPGNDVVTYSRIAAGVDAQVTGRNTAGAISLRYERRIGWEKDSPDGDLISGIARVGVGLIPQTLTLEAGGIAARTRVEGNGASILSPIVDNAGKANIYGVYAGPSLHTGMGDLEVEGHYRIGYTKVEEPDALVSAPGAEPVDVFDESVVQNAQLRVGARPNTLLPVGVGVGAGWYREDINNLDQRVDDRHVRADVTVPVSPSLALVGGVGYEDVKISSRDAVLDGQGKPVVGADGRYVTDKSSPRQIAYQTDGLIWDAGVLWRPSRRTSLEAHVGRRYGSMSYYGSLSYQPSSRSSFNVGVYDTVSGFGGQLNNALANLPTEFQALRNPISGDITGCVDSLDKGACLGSVLSAVRSSTFRSRGVAATYAKRFGRWQAGIGAGYDNRKFIAADNTVLADVNGKADETVWLAAYLNGRLGDSSSVSTNIYASWFDSDFELAGGSTGFGASAAYYRSITQHLSATAAVSIDGVNRDNSTLDDTLSAAALLGMRYSF